MRKTLTFLAVLLGQMAYAQTISLSFKGTTDSFVKIQYPIKGANYSYFSRTKSYEINAQGNLKIPNQLVAGGNIYIMHRQQTQAVFIAPKKNIHITVSYVEGGKTLTASGANADGIMQVSKLNHPFYQLKARDYVQADSNFISIQKAISADLGRELHPLDSLLKIKKISPDFYRHAQRDIRYYYRAVSAAVIFGRFARTIYNVKHPLYTASMNPDYITAWPKIFKTYALQDPFAFGAPDFYYYAKDYMSWYKLLFLPQKNAAVKDPNLGPNYLNKYYDGFVTNFSGPALEYLLARLIHDEAMEMQYQPELVVMYNRFQKTYPKSQFTIFLTPLIETIKTFHRNAKQAFKPDQKLLDAKSVVSFVALAAQFKDKIVYVDMWATWCGPCKDQFNYNEDLKKYLKTNQVEMLYISMDKDEADQQWQDMIRFYNLSGNHIRTTDRLRKDLMKVFWDGSSYAIPRYVILKNGVVVERDAMQPEDKEKLYQQIGKYL